MSARVGELAASAAGLWLGVFLTLGSRISRSAPKGPSPKVALVCSHGGHLTELVALNSAWDGLPQFWVTYDSARTRKLEHAYRMRNIGFNPILLAIAFARIAWIFARERPNVVITDGAEIAIPAVLVGRLVHCRVIFVEVWTRVRMPTMTGRILYPLCDAFFVMWPDLLDAYGSKARYEGGLM
jgi:UDP-N-acetylglucosamine:LPS N-acetylglucosamine transferase